MPEGKVSVPSTLSGHAAEIYRSAFLGAYEGTCAKPGGRRGGAKVNRDACAAKIAWGAVKGKYKKGKDGSWVAKAGDPVVGPISDVPLQTSLPVYGTGVDHRKGEEGTKLQRWRRAYIKALRDECRNADQPVECARRKANIAAGFVDTDVKPIQRGGTGSGHHEHEGRPGEVGGSLPSGAGAPSSRRIGKRRKELAQPKQAEEERKESEEEEPTDSAYEPPVPEHWDVYPPEDANGNRVTWDYVPQDQQFEWNEALEVVGQIPHEEKIDFMNALPHDTREMTADQRWDLAKLMLDMPAEKLFDYEQRLKDKPNVRDTERSTKDNNTALRLQGVRDVVYGSANYLRQMASGADYLDSRDEDKRALGESIIRNTNRDFAFDVLGVDWWPDDEQGEFRAEWEASLSAEERSMIKRGGPGSGHRGHKGRPGEVGGSLPSGAGARPAGVREAGEKYERSPMERRLDGMRKHKFLTKEIEKKLPPLYSQENVTDPVVQAKWFDPWSKWAWFATEYDPEEGMFFGWVYGDFPELGYFSRKELAEVQVKFGLPIERDLYFKPKPLSEVQAAFKIRAFYRTKDATYPLIRIRGGAGSGHRGHEGRPGEVGGSQPGAGGGRRMDEGFYEMGEDYIGPRKPLSGQEQVSQAARAGVKSDESMPKASTLKRGDATWNKWVKAVALTNTLAQLRDKQSRLNEQIGKAYADKDDKELGDLRAQEHFYTDVVGYQNFPELRSINRSNGRSGTMDKFNDYPLTYVERREFDTAKRLRMAQAGTAMSDGSFPIATGEDVTNALRSLGRTSKPRSGVIAHIRKRAKAIGFEMTPALKRKAATIKRYLDRKVLRSQANDVDMQHIRTLADNPINRPDYISSEVWRSLPTEQRTVQAEASRRIVERNYAQAVEDAEMIGWRVSRHYYSPDDYYFTKRFSKPGEDDGVLVRAIMVRRVDSVEWELLAMSEFASSSIARMLPSDIVQHKSTGLAITPLIEG